ncbi:hypothetical protein [Streptomyces sp. NRRL F-5135]|nr:hypothetical protein [Streptomyces sp. NRRL F-5135]
MTLHRVLVVEDDHGLREVRLRRKLRDVGGDRGIGTVRGVGYRFG